MFLRLPKPEGQAFSKLSPSRALNVISDDIDLARSLLRGSNFSRDQLPYTPEFDYLKREYAKHSRRNVNDSEFWQLLTRAGKRGGLGRDNANKTRIFSPKQSTENQLELMRLLPEIV